MSILVIEEKLHRRVVQWNADLARAGKLDQYTSEEWYNRGLQMAHSFMEAHDLLRFTVPLPDRVKRELMRRENLTVGGAERVALAMTFVYAWVNKEDTVIGAYRDTKTRQVRIGTEGIRERPNEVKIKAERIYGTTYRKDGPSLPLGGTHASPVRHEVAGHYRTRNGRTFWVRGYKRGIDGPKKVRLT